MGDSIPPDLGRLDLEFDFTRPDSTRVDEDYAVTQQSLAPLTPLPRCLTNGARSSTPEQRSASPIPKAPRVPHFCLSPTQRIETAQTSSALPAFPKRALGPAGDRVAPGSAALVSTFRPKPAVRSCYSVKGSSSEECVYRTRRSRGLLAKKLLPR